MGWARMKCHSIVQNKNNDIRKPRSAPSLNDHLSCLLAEPVNADLGAPAVADAPGKVVLVRFIVLWAAEAVGRAPEL